MVEVRVRQYRERHGLTLRQLSEFTGISRSQLNRIENGDSLPTIDKAFDIAHALGENIEDVFPYTYIEKPQSQ